MTGRYGISGSTTPGVSVVCPFYNEEAIIARAVERMVSNLKRDFGDGWELILIDDGSVDSSIREVGLSLSAVGHDASRIHVLQFPFNQGRGRAIKAGIDAAAADIVVTTEVDCSWGDDVVRLLVDRLESDPAVDFVIASPHLKGGGLVNVPLIRRLLTGLGNLLIRTFFESDVTMNTGMTRAYRTQVIRPLDVYSNDKEFHLEVVLKLLTLGFHHAEIPATITWQHQRLLRTQRSTRRSSTKLMRTMGTHLQFVAIAQPVRYFAWLAAGAFVLAVGFLVAATIHLILGRTAAYLAIVGLESGIVAILFTGLSVLFAQLRQVMRDNWARAYPGQAPPSAHRARAVTGDESDPARS